MALDAIVRPCTFEGARTSLLKSTGGGKSSSGRKYEPGDRDAFNA